MNSSSEKCADDHSFNSQDKTKQMSSNYDICTGRDLSFDLPKEKYRAQMRIFYLRSSKASKLSFSRENTLSSVLQMNRSQLCNHRFCIEKIIENIKGYTKHHNKMHSFTMTGTAKTEAKSKLWQDINSNTGNQC